MLVRTLYALCLSGLLAAQNATASVVPSALFQRCLKLLERAFPRPDVIEEVTYVDGVRVVYYKRRGDERGRVLVGNSPSANSDSTDFDSTDRGIKRLVHGEHHDLTYPPELMNVDELRGKKVADIGTGRGRFVFDLMDAGIDAVGVDPRLTGRQKNNPKNFVTGFAEKIPLESNSIDVAYSNWSVFLYRHTEQDYLTFMGEMHRIAKPGGKIRIGPYVPGHTEAILKMFPDLRVTASSTKGPDGKVLWQGQPWGGEWDFIEFTKK